MEGSDLVETVHAVITGIDTAASRRFHEERTRWREDDLQWRHQVQQHLLAVQRFRQQRSAWWQEDIRQRSLDSARILWARTTAANRRSVEEIGEKLRTVSELAALIAGFAVLALLDFQFPGPTDGLLVRVFGLISAVTVGVEICSMVVCALVLVSLVKMGGTFISDDDETAFFAAALRFAEAQAFGDGDGDGGTFSWRGGLEQVHEGWQATGSQAGNASQEGAPALLQRGDRGGSVMSAASQQQGSGGQEQEPYKGGGYGGEQQHQWGGRFRPMPPAAPPSSYAASQTSLYRRSIRSEAALDPPHADDTPQVGSDTIHAAAVSSQQQSTPRHGNTPSKRAPRPPRPAATLDRQWELGCEGLWRLATALFLLGFPCFCTSIALAGYLKFSSAPAAAMCVAGAMMVGFVYSLATNRSLLGLFMMSPLPPAPSQVEAAEQLASLGLPFAWHSIPQEVAWPYSRQLNEPAAGIGTTSVGRV